MKFLKSAFFGLMAAMALAGCTSEILSPDDDDSTKLQEGDGDEVYMSLDILLPDGLQGSRSSTITGGGSSDGTEEGTDAENGVGSALIVLARQSDNGFIAAGEVNSNRITSDVVNGQQQYTALTRISKTNLNQYYEELGEGQVPTVNVFVFCNPNKDLVNDLRRRGVGDKTWTNLTCKVIQGSSVNPYYNMGIWTAGSFLMNSVNMAVRALPDKLLDWETFNKSDYPFHLSADNATETNPDLPDNSGTVGRGAIRVERSVARFDFKDGSPTKDQTYEVLYQYVNGVPNTDMPLVNVKLLRMCLVNMSNSFYHLPRVSNNGQLDGEGYQLLGKEKPWTFDQTTLRYSAGNYLVGPYASAFGAEDPIVENFSTYFNYPFFDDNGTFNNDTEVTDQWDVYDISTVLAGQTKDNYQGKSDYTVWRYVTENLIPYPRTNQVNGVSTGIVFKGRLLGTQFALDGKAVEEKWEEDIYANLAKCLNGQPFQIRRKDHSAITGVSVPGGANDPILYYLDGKLYLTWEHIRQAAIQAAVTIDGNNNVTINRSNSLYRAVFGDGPIPAGNVYLPSSTLEATPIAFTDPRWDATTTSAEYQLYMKSADYAWTQWDLAGQYVAPIGQGDPEKLKPLMAMREAITAAGITIYQTSLDENGQNPGYYCYYYYWNRHNDNGLSGVMGPMEFDVVRNNVYKLSVDKIERLGHPRIPENDPDNPTPETYDEVSNVYLDVTVEIVPWAVRKNSITF